MTQAEIENRIKEVKRLIQLGLVLEHRMESKNIKPHTKKWKEAQANFFIGVHFAQWFDDKEKPVDTIIYYSILGGRDIKKEAEETLARLENDLVNLLNLVKNEN